MKRIMSKILIILILFVMMFEIVFSSNVSHALTITAEQINTITNLAGGLVSIIYWPKRIMIVGLSFVINIVTANMASSTGVNYGDAGILNVITPFDIFFNKYKLLDINFFDIDGAPADSITRTMRLTISGWYYVMRTIAAAILLCILIYVGIRMALTTIAEDKAKYKKMLFDWIVSLALIFVLHYIAVFIIYANNAIVNVLRTLMEGMSKVTDANFGGLPIEDKMTELIIEIGMQGIIGVGIPSMAAVLVFVFIIFQTIAFLIAYLNRMIKIGFLIMISPLISITYSIDKMGDGKAQALGNWLREFIFTILIQPFHCLMYIAFVRTAFTLITSNGNILSIQSFADGIDLLTSPDYNQLVNGVLAILCLKFINDGEKIVRKIFGFQDDNSLTSMAAGMAVGMMAVKNAKKMGATARKGINMAKNTSSNLSKAFAKDTAKLRAKFPGLDNKLSNIENKVNSAKDWANGKTSAAKDWTNKNISDPFKKGLDKVNNFAPIKGARTLAGKFSGSKVGKFMQATGKKAGNYMARQNSMASTLAIMGAAMAYSTGTNDLGQSLGIGQAVGDGAQELFSTSTGNLAKRDKELHQKMEQQEYDDLGKTMDQLQKDNVYKRLEEYADADDKLAQANEAENNVNGLKGQIGGLEDKDNRTADEEQKLQELKQQLAAAEADAETKKAAAEGALADARRNDPNGEYEDLYAKMTKDEGDTENKTFAERFEAFKQRTSDARANFNSPEEIRKRFMTRSQAPKSSEIEAKKNEIIRKLTRLKIMQKTDGSSDQEVSLDLDEMDTIEETAQRLVDNISLGVLKGNSFSEDAQKGLVKNALGLDSNRYDGALASLYASTTEFERLQNRSQIAESYSMHSKYDGDSEELLQREIRMTPRVKTDTKETSH